MGNNKFIQDDFRGYKQSTVPKIDEALARTDPETVCGEYLRRYWHPVALTKEVGQQPISVKILGESLILFRTKNDKYGLVHKQCPHRNASLIFGKCEKEYCSFKQKKTICENDY